jgi:hypothetical protein
MGRSGPFIDSIGLPLVKRHFSGSASGALDVVVILRILNLAIDYRPGTQQLPCTGGSVAKHIHQSDWPWTTQQVHIVQ